MDYERLEIIMSTFKTGGLIEPSSRPPSCSDRASKSLEPCASNG